MFDYNYKLPIGEWLINYSLIYLFIYYLFIYLFHLWEPCPERQGTLFPVAISGFDVIGNDERRTMLMKFKIFVLMDIDR